MLVARSRALGALGALLLLFGACAPASVPPAAKPAPAATQASQPSAGAATAAGQPAAAAPPKPAAQAAAPTAAPAPVHVRLSGQKLAVEGVTWLADERGYFRQQGIEIENVTFGSASEMIPALATGQLEVAPMPANPAMWNAVARGVNAHIVLDLDTYRPGDSEQAIAVRKAVWDAGRGHQLEDLRTLSLAITPPGKATTSACALSQGLARAGLTLDDLDIQPITFPDMVGAFANNAVDAALIVEPFLTRAVQQGTAVRFMGLGDIYPNFTIATLGFADPLYNNRPAAKGFVRAYVKAMREYLAAMHGQAGDAVKAQVVDVISRGTGIDPDTVRAMTPPSFSPNALPNRDSMMYCYQFFRDQGLIPQPISDATFQTLWGTDLVNEVLDEVGRLPES
ncbi:MAG TPA: ABC transporter substrate-binding protein [Chloroflexota bacterium]|jgi:NitT/TauT family transport system substrate-binding protein